ncbi:MAG: hypothetical protein ACI8RZ_003609 [Myxococcota bacterium]|jgi:hypothetical protein
MKQSLRRRMAFGGNATLVTVIVIAVFSLLYVLSDQYRVRWDFSEGASNTLQPDTLSKLRLLDADQAPVTITAFTAQNGKEDAYFKNREVRDLLREIDNHSTSVTWRLVDFDKERLTAERLGVNDYGRIVIQRGEQRVDIKDRKLFRRAGRGKDRRLDFMGEAALSRGFAQLMSDSRRAVYVLTGHGELSVDDVGPDGLSQLSALLDQERYDLKPLNLLSTGRDGEIPQVPDDAAAVFVARPRASLTPQEDDVLLSYLGRGGALLIAVDVGTPVPDLLSRVGVTVPDGVVVDERFIFPFWDRPELIVKPHDTTAEIQGSSDFTPILAHAAPLRTADPVPPGVRYEELMATSRTGWIERGGESREGRPVYDPEIDGAGPLTVATAITIFPGKGLVRSTRPAGRITVFGDGDMFTNSLIDEGPGNALLAVNQIHWLAGEDKRLSFGGGRTATVRRLAITREELGTLRLLSLGLMPSLVLLFGVLVWRTRRGR